MMKDALLVIVGGGVGAVLRELLMLSVASLPGGFPMPIFIANVLAALLIGIFASLGKPGGPINSRGKLLLTTGVLGGMSTFSSFIWGTHQMLMDPAQLASGLAYVVASMVGGWMLVEVGFRVGDRLRGRDKSAT